MICGIEPFRSYLKINFLIFVGHFLLCALRKIFENSTKVKCKKKAQQ